MKNEHKALMPALNKYYFLLLSIILFFVLANIVWIKEDKAPPLWDQSHYLLNSEILYHTLAEEGLESFLLSFNDILKDKAPLITALPIPFYVVFGNNYTSALLVNLFFIVLGSYYLYKLVTYISGEKEALLSVFILNTFPLIFAMSREFMVEYGLMVLVIMWMYYFLKSNCFERESYAVALGIILGLGMLMKISFVLYIIFPTAFICIKKFIRLKKIPVSFLVSILIVFIIGLFFAGNWYLKNFHSIINYAFMSGYTEIAKNYSMGEVFSIKTILRYWVYIINYGISAYFFFLIILFITINLSTFKKNKPISHIEKEHVYFLAIWFMLPFIVFTFGINKDYRYTAPLYPVLAVLLSVSLVRLSINKYGTLLLFMLLLFPILNYFYISFSHKPVHLKINKIILLQNNLAYAHPPIKEKWPYEEIMEFIYEDALKAKNQHPITTLLFNYQYMNDIALNYYSKNKNLEIRFRTNTYFIKENIDETVAEIERYSHYLMTKSDKLGPEFSNVKNIQVLSLLNKGELNFKPLTTMPLPDQTFLTVYKKYK
jgi:4-amino-4-deoxy-L-arabinose transferase-like glycosyltransferase